MTEDAPGPAVRLGTILFTIVEPHPGHEVAYNRWYERDHFYAGCMVGPGILAGRRFVCTGPYKELRYPERSPITPDNMTGSYLAMYWVARDQQDEWGRWAGRRVHELHQAGRMFAERDHVHTKLYRYRWGVFRDPDGVPAELALDHPFRGVAVVFGQRLEPPGRVGADAWLRDDYLPSRLAGGAAAMCLSFSPVPIPDDAPADVPRDPADAERFLLISFLDRDPAEAWAGEFAGLGEDFERSGLARLLWASPFIPTIPGTDTYTDQLR